MLKASERLLFSLFIINQYCTPDVCYTTKNVFKTSDRLLFSLLSYFSNMEKNVYSNQVKTYYFSNTCLKTSGGGGAAFQFIKLLFVIQKNACSKQAGIRKMHAQIKRGLAFFSLFG